MNKIIKEVAILAVVLILIALACGKVFGVNVPQKPKDLRDFLIQPPNSVYRDYGYSEETLLLYNLIDLRARCNDQELRIKALESKVAELKSKNIFNGTTYQWPNDVNSVDVGKILEAVRIDEGIVILDWVQKEEVDPNEG